MLKPVHIQVVTKISDGSAVSGLPSQARVQPSRPRKRSSALTAPQS